MKLKPYQHQTLIVERFRALNFGALFMEQGTGKSKCFIDIAEYQHSKGWITGVFLIVGGKILLRNWQSEELPKHSQFPHNVITFRPGHLGSVDQAIASATQGYLTWFIVNVDSVIEKSIIPYARDFLTANKRFSLMIDESTCVKSMGALSAIKIRDLALHAQSRFIGSGTAITKNPLDLYAQAEVLQPGLLGVNFWAFKTRYCNLKKIKINTGRTFKKVTGYTDLDELTKRVQNWAVILKKVDCLDLPPKVYRTVDCPLTDEQWFYIEKLKAQAAIEWQGQTVKALNVISLINKILQICAGQIKLPDGTYGYLENDRIDLVEELINEAAGAKTIVWYAFKGVGTKIAEKLKNRAVHIHSGMSDNARYDALQVFKTDPEKDALIMNPAMGGKGLTIVEATNALYHSRTYNYEDRAQSEERIHRIGQTKSVLVTDIVDKNCGTELGVIKNLTGKKDISDLVLQTAQELITQLDLFKVSTKEEAYHG